MKKSILMLTLWVMALSGGFQAKAQEVVWHTIEQAAQIDVRQNKKLFFMDFYTSWCGWCKRMDQTTFIDPTVVKILNTYYIPVKFDAEGNSKFLWAGNNYSNDSRAAQNRPNTHGFARAMLGMQMGFPSYVFFSPNQTKVSMVQGYQSAEDMVVILWYYASGDYKKYAFDKYRQIFDKTIRPTMNAKLGIK